MCSLEDFQDARETRQQFLRCSWKAFQLCVLRVFPSPLLLSREVVIVKITPPAGSAGWKVELVLNPPGISFTPSSSPEIWSASSQHSPCSSPSSHRAECSVHPLDLTGKGFSCFLLTPLFFCLLCLFTPTSVLTPGVANSVTCTFYHPKITLKNCAAWSQSFVWYLHLKQTSLVLPTQGCGIFLLNICSSCVLLIERISRIVHKTQFSSLQTGGCWCNHRIPGWFDWKGP